MSNFTQSWSYLLAAIVTFTLCLLVSTLVLVLHVYLLFQSPKKKAAVLSASPRRLRPVSSMTSLRMQQSVAVFQEHVYDYFDGEVHKQVLRYCTGLSLATFYLQIILSFIYRLNDLRQFGSHNWCNVYMKTVSFLWGFGKYNMYMVFIARVRVAFSESAYRYSNRTVSAMYFAVSAIVLPLIASTPWLTWGQTEEVKGKPPNDKVTVCVTEIYYYLALAAFLQDIVMSTTLVALFIRPLRKFFHDFSRHDSKHLSIRDIEMQMLPLKYTVTVSIGMVSTISCMLLIAATDAGVLVIIDCVVNMICVVSMTSYWKRVYWRLCAPMLQTIAYFDCCFDDQLRANLSRIIAHFSAATDTDESDTDVGSAKPPNLDAVVIE